MKLNCTSDSIAQEWKIIGHLNFHCTSLKHQCTSVGFQYTSVYLGMRRTNNPHAVVYENHRLGKTKVLNGTVRPNFE